ncbi:hypothetical protein V499_04595 [Pseudogymnoascus sp. VKM F-103]|nr:hypothetical protein V499_04595 [Pseudogymnoascus sp. VKM F-103]
MTNNSDTQSDLSPCSSFGTLDSLKIKGANIDLSYEECYEVDGVTGIEKGLSLLSVNDDSADRQKSDIQFDHTQCLFCKHSSIELDENLEHMLKRHGLFIPHTSHLVVDIETLAEYLHLLIFVYFECLYCGSQRSSAQAAQQHMMGKGHCKIDILSEDSEFRDFYDFHSTSDDSDGGSIKLIPEGLSGVVVEESMRLPSGKLLSHRTEGKRRLHQHRTTYTKVRGLPPTSPSTALDISRPQSDTSLGQSAQSESNKIAKREATFHNQLATLRAGDRMSLMHLSRVQQKAVIINGRKQVEKARRDENEMLLKRQIKANR